MTIDKSRASYLTRQALGTARAVLMRLPDHLRQHGDLADIETLLAEAWGPQWEGFADLQRYPLDATDAAAMAAEIERQVGPRPTEPPPGAV